MEFVFVGSLALIFVGALIMLFALQRHMPQNDTKAVVQLRISEIDTHTDLNNYNSLKSALIDYDTLFDHVMKDSGIQGNTLGERLKSARNYFSRSQYNDIWEAHKLRNQLVHEATFTTSIPALQRHRSVLKSAVQAIAK